MILEAIGGKLVEKKLKILMKIQVLNEDLFYLILNAFKFVKMVCYESVFVGLYFSLCSVFRDLIN